MIRHAVVGAGCISQEAFMPGVAQSGNSRISAIVTGDIQKAERLAAFHRVEHYAGYDVLVAGNTVDAVYIALPNSLHADCRFRFQCETGALSRRHR